MPVRTAILTAWGVFWVCWLIAATWTKQSSPTNRTRRFGASGLIATSAVVLVRVAKGGSLEVHALALQVIGVILFASGLGLAVWARVYLGRNWGMPMTRRAEPELVTSGPYRFVRHPIYSGILLGVLGTAVAVNLYWLITLALVGTYFVYSARVEEKMLASTFPRQYPAYREHTKMLIPFVL